jgi:hypothetical protein
MPEVLSFPALVALLLPSDELLKNFPSPHNEEEFDFIVGDVSKSKFLEMNLRTFVHVQTVFFFFFFFPSNFF